MASIYDINVTDNKGQDVKLSNYEGKTLLIVNTASKCGFTPQYTGLNEIYKKYHDRGVEVLGFPCNQFGGQEPGTDAEIADFCDIQFKIQFPLFSKIDVNGENAHPLFVYLKKEAPGLLGSEGIKWNFTKFLVDKTGKVVKRYAPKDAPEKIEPDIEQLLG